ncbi:hypothetical protein K457DRAFT_141766 [Linnemannia elongata AG-77]|uniref:Uncharacterized protein n=1 Tax=Linnemannia elongata AG-77 TaxID=1314771 RepID=A0A197JJG8_9FUNG|nr:hypothetical protein K457DRAFT_141766 [Linnemannia elongata AG-77]
MALFIKLDDTNQGSCLQCKADEITHQLTGIHSSSTLPLQTHLHGIYRPANYLKHAYNPTKHVHTHNFH